MTDTPPKIRKDKILKKKDEILLSKEVYNNLEDDGPELDTNAELASKLLNIHEKDSK